MARAKIDMIPHGIPEAMLAADDKDQLGVEGKSVILTFGLLSPDKGIEYVIEALPAILERHPDTVYVVLGATHPHVKKRHGETYRLMLEARAQRLGVDASMIFHDRFVSQAELAEFLSAADIYVTPYLNPEQSTSGTLAYAVGAGKAVISTPYRYASELLADGRGILVPWRDSAAIAREVIGLLGDEDARDALRQRAAAYGRDMAWPSVARSYVASLERAGASTPSGGGPRFTPRPWPRAPGRPAGAQPGAPPVHDRRHRHAAARGLRRAALRGRLLPGRQRARAAADGRCWRRRAPTSGRAVRAAGLALPGLRQPRLQPGLRAFPELHDLRTHAGSKTAARRTATGARCGRSAPWSAAPTTRAAGAWAATCFTPRCRR